MKKVSLIFAFLCSNNQTSSRLRNYKGVIGDANENAVANKSISGSIVISDGS